MWNQLKTQAEATTFMESVCNFHDSCIKELSYISGAYVEDDLAMCPINERRTLCVIFQRQYQDTPMIEMMFTGLSLLKLPVDDVNTCEILDATLLIQEGRVYWCDCGGMSAADMMAYEGTVICAEKAFWRPIKGHMGEAPFYLPADGGWGD